MPIAGWVEGIWRSNFGQELLWYQECLNSRNTTKMLLLFVTKGVPPMHSWLKTVYFNWCTNKCRGIFAGILICFVKFSPPRNKINELHKLVALPRKVEILVGKILSSYNRAHTLSCFQNSMHFNDLVKLSITQSETPLFKILTKSNCYTVAFSVIFSHFLNCLFFFLLFFVLFIF